MKIVERQLVSRGNIGNNGRYFIEVKWENHAGTRRTDDFTSCVCAVNLIDNHVDRRGSTTHCRNHESAKYKSGLKVDLTRYNRGAHRSVLLGTRMVCRLASRTN